MNKNILDILIQLNIKKLMAFLVKEQTILIFFFLLNLKKELWKFMAISKSVKTITKSKLIFLKTKVCLLKGLTRI